MTLMHAEQDCADFVILQLPETLYSFSLNYSNVQMATFAPRYAVSVGNCILLSMAPLHSAVLLPSRYHRSVSELITPNSGILVFWGECLNVLVTRRIM
jgi:hypothetical protein